MLLDCHLREGYADDEAIGNVISLFEEFKCLAYKRERENGTRVIRKLSNIYVLTDGGFRPANEKGLHRYRCLCETLMTKLIVLLKRVGQLVAKKDGAIITSLKSFYRDVQRRDKYEIVQKAMVAVEAFEDWNSNGKLLSDNGLYETTLDGQIVFRKASVTDHVI